VSRVALDPGVMCLAVQRALGAIDVKHYRRLGSDAFNVD
jgi:hypothetical protein